MNKMHDFRWQKALYTKSANDAETVYKYDGQGCLVELYAPFGFNTGHPTIHRQYFDDYPRTEAFWRHCSLWARTLNDNNGNNYIGTVTICDDFGRRIRRIHPSASQTKWDYDPAGNMTTQTQNSGEQISYGYNYSRPVYIDYSDRPWNNVWYEYGAAGSGNQAGRVIKQQDAIGVQEFGYDNMGNMVYNRHTYVQPGSPNTLTLTTMWSYDSWGRVLKILYPDNENVAYSYDRGGNVRKIEGMKPGIGLFVYIDSLGYDLYGQRVYQRNGKEKDYESGFHYYGARYYWSEVLTGWLSVDPMMDKYPSVSPYNYCHWNPIRLIDPNGMEDWEVNKLGYITKREDQSKSIKGVDRLFAGEKFICVEEGTLSEQIKGNLDGYEGHSMKLHGSREENVDIFKFCTGNSVVEYSLMEFEGNQTYLTTSHTEPEHVGDLSTDNFGSAMAKHNAIYLVSHLHNHYNQAGRSCSYDENARCYVGDGSFKETIDAIRWKAKLPPAQFGVYKCGKDSKTLDYDFNLIDPVSMMPPTKKK